MTDLPRYYAGIITTASPTGKKVEFPVHAGYIFPADMLYLRTSIVGNNSALTNVT